MEDASYFTEFTNMCLKNTEIFNVNAFLLGWHDWVRHMARCWKSFLNILQSCNSFSAKVDFLLGSFPYHTYWTTMSTDGTSQPANGRISFPHCSSCTWRPSTLANHGSTWNHLNISCFESESSKFHFPGRQGWVPWNAHFWNAKTSHFSVPPSQWKPSQASQRLQELLLHPWVAPALSTTQVGVPFVGIFWVWPPNSDHQNYHINLHLPLLLGGGQDQDIFTYFCCSNGMYSKNDCKICVFGNAKIPSQLGFKLLPF